MFENSEQLPPRPALPSSNVSINCCCCGHARPAQRFSCRNRSTRLFANSALRLCFFVLNFIAHSICNVSSRASHPHFHHIHTLAPEAHLFHFERCSQCPSVRGSLRCNSTPDSFTHSAIFRRKWLFNPIKTQKNTDHQGLLILSCCSKVFFNLELVFVLTAQACLKEGIWLGLFGQPMTRDCDGCRHPRYNNNNCLSLSGGSLPAVF